MASAAAGRPDRKLWSCGRPRPQGSSRRGQLLGGCRPWTAELQWDLGLHRVDHGFRSPPDRRKLWSTSKEKTTDKEKTAVDVVDVDVVVEVGGRLEQPRRLFFNC